VPSPGLDAVGGQAGGGLLYYCYHIASHEIRKKHMRTESNCGTKLNSKPRRESSIPRLLWSPSLVRIASGGNLRECETVMEEAQARAWCRKHGVLFVRTGNQ